MVGRKKAADTADFPGYFNRGAASGEGAVRRRQRMTVGHPDEPCLALCNIAAQTIVHQKKSEDLVYQHLVVLCRA